MDSTPGLGRSDVGEMATYSSILAWEIQWADTAQQLNNNNNNREKQGNRRVYIIYS